MRIQTVDSDGGFRWAGRRGRRHDVWRSRGGRGDWAVSTGVGAVGWVVAPPTASPPSHRVSGSGQRVRYSYIYTTDVTPIPLPALSQVDLLSKV